MTKDSFRNRTVEFASRTLPWILSAAILALFLATLNHGATFGSIYPVAELSGWLQGGHYLSPLSYLGYFPTKMLPHSLMPLAMHLETALCGALAVCLLARSVTLLPQDRTPDQRNLEHSEHSTFSGRLCWLPPVFAALVLGLERTFWESSTEATGRMFALLGFAYCVRCLLEFRLDQNERWFSKFAFVYGLLMAENWLYVGFFPLFIGSVIWIRGLRAFDALFIRRVLLWGFLGLCLIFMLPLMNQFSHYSTAGFWETLKGTLIDDKRMIFTFDKKIALLFSLTSLIPLVVISFKWGSSFGDNSPFGIFLAGAMINLMNALFFLAGIWVALDAKINPRVQLPGVGDLFLPLNYLGALCVGYFAAYFLLMFDPGRSRSNDLSPLKPLGNWIVTSLVILLAVLVPILMVSRNLPFMERRLRAQKVMAGCVSRMEKSLPPSGAVVLSDDPVRLMQVRELVSEKGEQSKFLFMDTPSLLHRTNYARMLAEQNAAFPISEKWLVSPTSLINGAAEVAFLNELQLKAPIYYLHGSFGFFFECFWPEQHGLVCKLNNFQDNTWDAPPASAELIEANDSFFKDFSKSADMAFLAENNQLDENRKARTFSEKLYKFLRLKPEPGVYSATLTGIYSLMPLMGTYYSKSCNEWGVGLQKAGKLAGAAELFQMSTNIYPANGSARLNLLANKILAENKKLEMGNAKEVQAVLGLHFGYSEALYLYGVVDEPTFLSDLGVQFAIGGNYRQAIESFHRAMEIVRDKAPLAMKLAQIEIAAQNSPNQMARYYPYTNCYAEALTNLDFVLSKVPDYPPALFGKGVVLINLKQFDRAIQTLDKFLELEPGNVNGMLNRAICRVQTSKLAEARSDYNAVIAARPDFFPAYFGLGEVYYQEKNTNSALTNYELYLKTAPADTSEAAFVKRRVAELKPAGH